MNMIQNAIEAYHDHLAPSSCPIETEKANTARNDGMKNVNGKL
jgi:hypothetical protein